MTRKDFELIAEVIANSRKAHEETGPTELGFQDVLSTHGGIIR